MSRPADAARRSGNLVHVRGLAEKNGWRPRQYGESVEGVPLLAWWPRGKPQRLLWAAIHGEEAPTTLFAHQLLRTIDAVDACAVVVPVANPDGLLHGMRQNARGVDLNRNFPTADWRPGPSPTFWPTTTNRTPDNRTLLSSPGEAPASEPETQGLMSLFEQVEPAAVIDIHAPLNCVIATHERSDELARHLAEPAQLNIVRALESPTPGDSAHWVDQQGVISVTYEIEMGPFPQLWRRHNEGLARAVVDKLAVSGS